MYRQRREARRFPCHIAPFLPGDDTQVYFSEFQVGEEGGEPVFRGELPMMWPHLTLPVAFAEPGKYRLRTTLRTDRVETEGPAGSALQLQLLYRGTDGKPVSLNRAFPVQNGTRGLPDGRRLLFAINPSDRAVDARLEIPSGGTYHPFGTDSGDSGLGGDRLRLAPFGWLTAVTIGAQSAE